MTAIKLWGVFAGVFGAHSAALVRNDGEDGEGTLVTIKFTGELDTSLGWILEIPSDTNLIQSRFGGRLCGSLDLGQTLDDLPFGAVRISNLSDVGYPIPPPADYTFTAANFPGGVALDVNTGDAGNSPFAIGGAPDCQMIGAGAPSGAPFDLGGGILQFSFGAAPTPGNVFCWNPGATVLSAAGGALKGGYVTIT